MFFEMQDVAMGAQSDKLDAKDILKEVIHEMLQENPSKTLDVLNQMSGKSRALPDGFPSADDLFGGNSSGDTIINIFEGGAPSGDKGGGGKEGGGIGDIVGGILGGGKEGGGIGDIVGGILGGGKEGGEGGGLGGVLKLAGEVAPLAALFI